MSNITGQNRIKYQIDNAGSFTPATVKRSNAPVTRVLWECDNLPEGLTLSADGKISGRPTTTGSYICIVRVTTNWGTATYPLSIWIKE